MAKKTRNIWLDEEIIDLLAIIKENKIINMLDGKIKRNKNVFDLAAAEMAKKGHMKTGTQIKDKFKNLKRDYLNIKRNNNKSGSQRHSSQYFNSLDEILGHRPCASTVGLDTSEKIDEFMEMEIEMPDMEETEFEVLDMPIELPATSSQREEETALEFPTTSEQTVTPKTPVNTFKHTKKNTYQKVIAQFTQEWKNSQEEMMNKMKDQDDQFLKSIDHQMKEEREMLKEHREETSKMMEKDRQDMMGMFNAFLKTMKQQQAPMNVPQYGTFFHNAQVTNPASVLFTPISTPIATRPNATPITTPTEDFELSK